MRATSEIEIKSIDVETDSRGKNRFWLWLKIESDRNFPSEIKIKNSGNRDEMVAFENSRGKEIAVLPLGYHKLVPGVNYLPPMPITLHSPIHTLKSLRVEIKSIRDKRLHCERKSKVYFKPFLIV